MPANPRLVFHSQAIIGSNPQVSTAGGRSMFGGVTGLLLFLAAWPTIGDFSALGQPFAALREPSGKPVQARQLQLTSAETALAQDGAPASALVGSLSDLECGDDACRLDRYQLRNPLAVDEGAPHLFT